MLDHEPAADDDEGDDDAGFDRDDDIVEFGAFGNADDQQGRERHADQKSGKIEDRRDRNPGSVQHRSHLRSAAAHQRVTGGASERGWNMDAVITEQADNIARPTDCDHRRGKPIFEQQQRPHHPCGEFADGGVAIGIGRARHR